MRLVFGIDPSPFQLLSACAALCAALALATLPTGANAQASATDAAGVAAAQQAGIFVADETSNTADAARASASTPADADAAIGNEPDTADGSARGNANDIALDDQILSRQRGGAVGMVMVAATPQLMRGSSVTLWDEIAPPSPLPVPIDAARAAQGNVANYQRK